MSAEAKDLRSVVYRSTPDDIRGRITLADYDEAIQELELAKTQLEPDGRSCAVCTDSGHQAWECHHNPLVMARRAAQANAWEGSALPWRCFHCGQVFHDAAAAREHFGESAEGPPECISTKHPLVVRLRARLEAVQEFAGHSLRGPARNQLLRILGRDS